MQKSIGYIESFPSGYGFLSLFNYFPFKIRRVIYFKVDWAEQLKYQYGEDKNLKLKEKIKILYFEISKIISIKLSDSVLVRGGNLFTQYSKISKNVQISTPIGNFTREDAFLRDDCCNNDIINILFVGDLSNRKRPLDIIRALSLVEKKQKEKDFLITFVGKEHFLDIEKVKITEIYEEAKKVNLKSDIECLGHVNSSEKLKDLYKKADIFILPSTMEGFPRVVNESLLFSLPTIVTPVGGIPDELRDKVEVLFSQVGSIKKLSLNIQSIIEDKTLRKKLIEYGHKWGLENSGNSAFIQHGKLLGLTENDK